MINSTNQHGDTNMDKLKRITEVEGILNNTVSYSCMTRWHKLTESAKLEAIGSVTLDELITYLRKIGG